MFLDQLESKSLVKGYERIKNIPKFEVISIYFDIF